MSADGAHKAPVGGRVRVPLWERIAIFAFGAIFVVALLLLAVVFPKPTPFQYTVFRIVLALAAAGVATLVPGIIEVKYKTIIRAGGALAVFVIVYFFGPAILGVAPSEAPRIVISKFNIKPTDPANPSAGYEIDLYMVNRGNIIGRAPIYTVAFNSVDGFMSVADVDAEMAKVLQSAIQKPPPSSDDRDEIDVGAEVMRQFVQTLIAAVHPLHHLADEAW